MYSIVISGKEIKSRKKKIAFGMKNLRFSCVAIFSSSKKT